MTITPVSEGLDESSGSNLPVCGLKNVPNGVEVDKVKKVHEIYFYSVFSRVSISTIVVCLFFFNLNAFYEFNYCYLCRIYTLLRRNKLARTLKSLGLCLWLSRSQRRRGASPMPWIVLTMNLLI